MNQKSMRLAALSLLVVLLLSACNLPITPTPAPTPTSTQVPEATQPANDLIGASCVAGTWEINNLPDYLQAILPQIVEGAEIEVTDVSGTLLYTFNSDGTSAGTAKDFKIKANVKTNGISLPGQIVVNGTSTGKYQVDDSQGLLSLTGVSAGDLTVSASVAGIPVVSKKPLTDLFMLGSDQSGYGSVNYQCIGDSMKVAVEFPQVGTRIVELQRVVP